MKALFTVGAKLLGLLLLYWALASAMNVIGLAQAPLSLLFALSTSLLAFGCFYLLVFRTDRVAAWVGLGNDDASVVVGISTESSLRVGIALIGLYVFLSQVPQAIALIYVTVAARSDFGGADLLFRFATDGVPLALALVFILRPDWIARLATRVDAGSK